MSAVTGTGTGTPHRPVDLAVVVAQTRENVVVGNEIVRHNRQSRLIHWAVAATFFACVLTGMPIWTPLFGWMAHLFGGLSVCRVVHPWIGIAFFVASIAMFIQWVSEMYLESSERDWLGPKAIRYMRYEAADDSNVGKYNGGQKLLFWLVSLAALGLLVTGLLMWFPGEFNRLLHAARIRDARRHVHPLSRVDRLSHLPRHGRRAGHVRLHDPRHGDEGVGAPASSSLVPRGDG